MQRGVTHARHAAERGCCSPPPAGCRCRWSRRCAASTAYTPRLCEAETSWRALQPSSLLPAQTCRTCQATTTPPSDGACVQPRDTRRPRLQTSQATSLEETGVQSAPPAPRGSGRAARPRTERHSRRAHQGSKPRSTCFPAVKLAASTTCARALHYCPAKCLRHLGPPPQGVQHRRAHQR